MLSFFSAEEESELKRTTKEVEVWLVLSLPKLWYFMEFWKP